MNNVTFTPHEGTHYHVTRRVGNTIEQLCEDGKFRQSRNPLLCGNMLYRSDSLALAMRFALAVIQKEEAKNG